MRTLIKSIVLALAFVIGIFAQTRNQTPSPKLDLGFGFYYPSEGELEFMQFTASRSYPVDNFYVGVVGVYGFAKTEDDEKVENFRFGANLETEVVKNSGIFYGVEGFYTSFWNSSITAGGLGFAPKVSLYRWVDSIQMGGELKYLIGKISGDGDEEKINGLEVTFNIRF